MNKIEVNLKDIHPDIREWVNLEIVASNSNDIGVHLLKKRFVRLDGVRCSGFFCSETDRMMVALLSKDWVGIMAHESCHRDQYIEKSPIWNQKIELDGDLYDAGNLLWDWLAHKQELKPRKLNEVLLANMNLELDCEKRTVQKIDKFYLPLNVKEYTQKANAYVYLYLVMKYTRQWYAKGKSPFTIPEVWTKMPSDFDNDYTKVPTKIKNLILDNCFN